MKYTPSDHVDKKNLAQAIAKFKDLDSLFRQVKQKFKHICQIERSLYFSFIFFITCEKFGMLKFQTFNFRTFFILFSQKFRNTFSIRA